MLTFRLTMTGKRFKGSGRNVREDERNTEVLKIRCPPELAELVRAFCAEKNVTMAQVLAAGLAGAARADGAKHNPRGQRILDAGKQFAAENAELLAKLAKRVVEGKDLMRGNYTLPEDPHT